MILACLGPKGSYSCLAAEKIEENAEIKTYDTFPLVMQALKDGKVEGAVLPIENSIEGGVHQNMDLLDSTENVYAVKEYDLSIQHRLAYFKGADLSEIKTIYSHQQAVEQCRKYFKKYLPTVNFIYTSSTVAGLSMVTDKSKAGIVGAHLEEECNKRGLCLSEKNIADENNNFTRFLLIKKGIENISQQSKSIYFSFTCLDKPGELIKILHIFNVFQLNMKKIESRPIKNKKGEYKFFIEISANYYSQEAQDAIMLTKKCCQSFKVLGGY